MDILRKELNSIYESQHLDCETLDTDTVEELKRQIETLVAIDGGCAVITDASCDSCYIYYGRVGRMMGIADNPDTLCEFNSSDEDMVYCRIHPEDLVDKRMLEYEFFKMIDRLDVGNKTAYKATCRIRMMDREARYIYIANSTQVIRLSPGGRMWLILCRYDLAPLQDARTGISPCIVNNSTGEVVPVSFHGSRDHVLTDREKEILCLIQGGKLSKQIAAMLGISVHTVNRHRQNIIGKLSVSNIVEAIAAANAMRLL